MVGFVIDTVRKSHKVWPLPSFGKGGRKERPPPSTGVWLTPPSNGYHILPYHLLAASIYLNLGSPYD